MKQMISVLSLIMLSNFLFSYAMEAESKAPASNNAVIKNASYLVYEGTESSILGIVPAASRTVGFYTFDGELLATKDHNLIAYP